MEETYTAKPDEQIIEKPYILKTISPNFVLGFDDMGYKNPCNPCWVQFQFTVKKTIRAKMKYWLFCKFFPFKIVRWD